MGQEIVGALIHTLWLRSLELLAVDKLTDVREHIAIVLLAAVLDVLHQIVGIEVIHRHDVVGRVGGGVGQGRHLVRSLLQLLALVLVDMQSHTVYENHIIIGKMIEIIGSYLTEFDHSIVVGIRNLPECNGLIVEESDAGSTYPGTVSLRQTS